MKTSTFIRRFASVLLVIALMFPTFATAQTAGTNDFLKRSKGEQEETRQGKKMSHKMMQMQRATEASSEIPSATNLSKRVPNKNAHRAPLAVTESGAALYGNLIYHSQWQDASQTGYYSIDPNSGEYLPITTNELLAGASTVIDGIAYVSYVETYLGMYIMGMYTVVYDIEGGEIIEYIDHGGEDFSYYAINMAYNYADDMIYALTYDENGATTRLSTFDRTNYTYTPITDFPDTYDIYTMTFDPEGNLYMIFADGIIRQMDPATGEIIGELFNTGFEPVYMQSACWSPKDNYIIWAASNDDESHIIAVDIAASSTEILCSYSHLEEWVSLYTTDPVASDDAPEAPAIEVVPAYAAALNGNIKVTAPSTTVSGNTLNGAGLSLVIELNGVEIYNDEVSPGELVSLEATFAEGNNTARAYAANAAGKGIITSEKFYAGNDTPLPVTNLEVSVADGGIATLTWAAPTGGANGGYVDLSALTYNIERLGEVVATGITNTTYVDQLPDGMAQYEWAVYAVYGDKVSAPTYSDKILHGDAIALPYEHTFDHEGCLDIYTIIDNNGDNKTWTYDAAKSVLQYTYHTTNNGDDYAITPPIHLTNEKMISVEVSTYCHMLSYPERIEITLGTSTNPADHIVIIPNTDVTWNAPQTIRANISVEEEGSYYIGIHATSYADQYYLLVKDIKVSEAAGFDAPKAVENVTATPGANGALTATLAFTAPTETFGGDPLTEDVTVTAYRNDAVVGTTTCTPGGTGAIVDNNAVNGVNKYVLVTSNSAGNGDMYEISCYVGVDIPASVTNIKFTTAEDNMSSVMTWDVPVGAQGGYINPEELIYTIYVPTSDGYNITPVDETTELSYEITTNSSTLEGYSYYVSAKNSAGESDAYGGSVVLGKPYTLPFVEQLEGTTLVNSPWYTYSDNSSYAEWEMGGMMENYNLPEPVTAPDGGMFICYDFWEYADGSCGLLVPKVTLAGADAPTLYFSMYHYTTASDINELVVSITTDDDSYEEIFAKKVNNAPGNGWVEYQVNLDEYKDATWIGIMFDAYIAANGFVFIDYIKVENAAENDVMLQSLVAPSNVTMGEEVEFIANVLNKGSNTASYDVTFYVDDEEVTTVTESELASNESKAYTAKFTTKAENIGEMIVKAVVTMSNDEVENNNEATTKVTVTQPYLPVVTDLAGEEVGGAVTLTWSEPIIAGSGTIDNMEKYESFIIDNIGDYTVVDADNLQTYGIQGYDGMPYVNGPKAWQVWAPGDLGITTDTWLPYSGDKCLVAFACWDGPASDWLITPEIMGGTEVSFYANIPTDQYGAESFEVLYSTTDTNIESFEVLEQESKGTLGWEKYTYMLPNDAKYFAIRYTSYDIFALLVDDFSFVESSSSSDLAVVGYNVYHNGNKINTDVITETTYTTSEILANAENTYNVTVVYNEGESLFSNTVVFKATGIEDINDLGVNVYGQDDFIKIENVSGRIVNIYTVDGKVVYNAKATDNDILIPANLGVYIVNIDNVASCKVFVR